MVGTDKYSIKNVYSEPFPPADPETCPQGYGLLGMTCLSTGQYARTYDQAEEICNNRTGALYEPRTSWDLDALADFLVSYSWTYNARVNVVYKVGVLLRMVVWNELILLFYVWFW